MTERENLSTGIYAALSAFVVMVCLIGAFVLPSSLVNGKWLGIIALIGFFVGIRYRVDYVDLMGITHRAICKSGFFQGVEWEKDGVLNDL